MSVGIPVKLIHEATGHVVTIELKTGCVYRGTLLEAEDSLNCQLRNVTATARDGNVTEIEQIYIRGSHVRLVIVPDMLRNAPMFKKIGAAAKGHSGVAKAKGTVARMAGTFLLLDLPSLVKVTHFSSKQRPEVEDEHVPLCGAEEKRILYYKAFY